MARAQNKGTRWRLLVVALLAAGAALPALDGYLARHALDAALAERGVEGEHIVIVPGWLSSRAVFPLPGEPDLIVDLRLYHGPYTGGATPGSAWGWLAAGGELRDRRGQVATVRGALGLGGRFSLTVLWEEPPESLAPALAFGAVTMALEGSLFSTPARLAIEGQALHWRRDDLAIAFDHLALDAAWPPAADQPWYLLGDVSNVALIPAGPVSGTPAPPAATAESGKLTIDWQPGLKELAANVELDQLAGGGSALDTLALGTAIAPLDPEALGETFAALPAGAGNLSLHFLPLLASRPVLTIDRLAASAGERRFMLDGRLAPRPGGLSAQTHGGGDGEILEAAVRLYHFRQPLDQPAAAAVVEQIRRQGWLQRQNGEWRADIIINF